MRIAIIGAGFTGLTAALRLAQSGHTVTVFEREGEPGGLAAGFKDEDWEWPLERHYHHIFTSDIAIQKIAQEVGQKYFFIRPTTSTYYDGEIRQLDSPASLLLFDRLPFWSRVKTGLAMAYLKYLADWKNLEKTTAAKWLQKVDDQAYKNLWEPLLKGKFGEKASQISAAWFWARIKKRSTKLGYFDGGFSQLAHKLEAACRDKSVVFEYHAAIESINVRQNAFDLQFGQNKRLKSKKFDQVLVTGPSFVLSKLVPQLPQEYKRKLASYEGLGAVNVVVALKRKFFPDNTYWLNMNDRKFPFLAVVEHTNLIDKSHYDGDHLLYIGNYLDPKHEFFELSENELIQRFSPFLLKLNPEFSPKQIRKVWVFKARFAQPVVGVNYSREILPFETPIRGLYWASMQQVYPWDRGTNYAVEMGEQIAKLMGT